MISITRLSFQTLVTLSCLPLSSFANDLLLRNDCDAVSPLTVTYTATVFATAEATTNEPSATTEAPGYYTTVTAHEDESQHSALVSSNPYPIPVEHESCFNRSSTLTEYAYSAYLSYSAGSNSATPTPGGSVYYSAPIYGKPNATSKCSPTASGGPTIPTPPNSTFPAGNSTIDLDGATEHGYNKKNTPFSIKITGSTFDVNQTIAFANFKPVAGISVKPDSVSFSGFVEDYVLLSLFALDQSGSPIIKSWELHFGSVDMPILILNPDNTPAAGVHVEANATIYPGLSGSCTTDASGKCLIQNLPGTTIGLVARKDDNSIAVNGLAPTTVQVTLKLLPFITPKPGASFNTDNGTAGWTGGTLNQSVKIKRDTTLVVNTNGEYILQSASNSFPASDGIKKAYIKYRFITSEVPGGFFGTQFNDYFSVTIRSDTGAYVTVTNSMNALGLGAFDASGATSVFTLTLDVPANTKSIAYDIGVANVADNLYDSSLVVEKVGEDKCDKCDSCEACPSRPACQPNCKSPPPQSCGFYADCAEAELKCGPGGYPIRYGQKNCLAFSKNLAYFTPQGQNFIWGTMSCLQQFLSPLLQSCDETCDSISAKAFASHPKCYTDNGFCSLGCGDIIALLMTVNKDLLESGQQIIDTAGICLSQAVETLKGCAGEIFVGTAAAVTFGGSVPITVAAVVAGRYLSQLMGI